MVSQSTKYDHLFKNVIPNTIEGIRIFGKNDNYTKPQDYDNVLNLETLNTVRYRTIRSDGIIIRWIRKLSTLFGLALFGHSYYSVGGFTCILF